MREISRLELTVVIGVLLLSLVLRLANLSAFVVHDEMRWACRSVRFRNGLTSRDWGETYRVGHPGVVTMWLGALSIGPRGAQAEEICEAFDDYRHFRSDDLPASTKDELAEVGAMVFQGRRGVALFTWLCIVAIYLLTRSLWGGRIGLVSLILVALDPFYLGLSRFLHTDAVLASLMTVSVLALLNAMRHRFSEPRGRMLLVLSGVAGGLAVTQKSPAGFLAPFLVLIIGAGLLRRGDGRAHGYEVLPMLIAWGVTAAVTYVGAWPAMWSEPVETVRKVLGTATRYAAEGHTPGNFFLGRPVHDPGWLFYPVAALFRLSPLVVLGLAGSIVRLTLRGPRQTARFSLLALLSYSGLFTIFMSLGDKMFDRYMLPVFPALGIAAAQGLVGGSERLCQAIRRCVNGDRTSSPPALLLPIVLVILVAQVALVVPHHPYYLTYYDPLLGGAKKAQRVLLVGWGEGYDQVAEYLNGKPKAEELLVTTPTTAAFAPLFEGETWPMDRYFPWQSDYVVFYISDVQRRQQPALLQRYLLNPSRTPERVVSLHGVDYAWVYHNDDYEEAVARVEQLAQADRGECVLANGKSLFVKHYKGNLPLHTFSPEYDPKTRSYTYPDLGTMSDFLDGITGGCSRIWYPRYPEAEGDRYLNLLEARGLLLDRASFRQTEVTRHQLVDPAVASRELDLAFEGLRLVSYGVTDPPPAWGRDGGIVLTWEATEELEEDYSVYLHVYDSHGHRIVQGDSLIVDRTLEPTSRWETSATRSALYHLAVPPGTPPGVYDLEIGVYTLETGERLRLLGSDEAANETDARVTVEIGRPDEVPNPQDLSIPRRVVVPVTANLNLLGYELEPGRTGIAEAMFAGETVGLRLFWQANGAIDRDYRLRLSLAGRDGAIYGQEALDVTSTNHPTSEWQPDELVADWYYLSTEESVPTGEATLSLELLDVSGEPVLVDPVELLDLWVQSTTPGSTPTVDPEEPVSFTLGEGISLLGYTVDRRAEPGETVAVTLYWRADRAPDRDYKVFVHLYDGRGGILAQRDRHPGLGARPTTNWEKGEIVADRYHVQLASATPPGIYSLGIGLYDPASGDRLFVYGPGGDRLPDDRVMLGNVEVEP